MFGERMLDNKMQQYLFINFTQRIYIMTIEDFYVKASGFTEADLKLEIAVMLFEKERLSLRKAASLAGLHWLHFMKELDRREITLHYDESLL